MLLTAVTSYWLLQEDIGKLSLEVATLVCMYNSNYYHVNTDPIIITADTDNPEPGVVRKYQVHFQ